LIYLVFDAAIVFCLLCNTLVTHQFFQVTRNSILSDLNGKGILKGRPGSPTKLIRLLILLLVSNPWLSSAGDRESSLLLSTQLPHHTSDRRWPCGPGIGCHGCPTECTCSGQSGMQCSQFVPIWELYHVTCIEDGVFVCLPNHLIIQRPYSLPHCARYHASFSWQIYL